MIKKDQQEYQKLTEAYSKIVEGEGDEFDMAGQTGLGPLDDTPDPDLMDQEEKSEHTPIDPAWGTLYTALQTGDINIKDADPISKSLTISTGDERSVIVKVVGFEGDHDIPISLRPDSAGARHRMSRASSPETGGEV